MRDPGVAAARAFAWLSILGFCFLPAVWAMALRAPAGIQPLSPSASFARTLRLTGNTLAVAGGAAALAFFLGLPYGLLVSRTNLWLRRFFESVLFAALLVPAYVSGTGWIYAIGAQGFLNASARSLVNPGALPFRSIGMPASMGTLGLSLLPLVALSAAAAARRTSRDLEDTASLVTGTLGVLRAAVLPYVLPASATAAGAVFILAAGDFGVSALFGVNVLTVEAYEQFSAYYNVRAALVAMAPLLAIVVLGLVAALRVYGGAGHEAVDSNWARPRAYCLGWWQPAMLCFCVAVLGLVVVVPASALFLQTEGFTAFRTAWAESKGQIGTTAVCGLWASTIATLAAIPAAYFIARSGRAGNRCLWFLVVIAVAIPGCITGTGLISLWNHPGPMGRVYTSEAMIVLGYLGRFLPLAALIVAAGVRQISPEMEEPARLAGAGWAGVLRTAIIPYVRGWLLVSWAVVFALCIGELATTLLVSPPGCETLPVHIFGLMHFGASSIMAALSLIVAALALVPAVFAAAIVSVLRRTNPGQD